MDAVSIDEKENRELDIIFSKMWSENISNIFLKDFCCLPSSRAVYYPPVIRNSLCDFRWCSSVWTYQLWWGHHSSAEEVNTAVMDILHGLC
jgi:hypothetical protein